jgi:Flp pilus assembly protein TadG
VTVVVAAIVALSLVVCLGLADLGAVLVARARARAAADAAALAAAQELAFPSGGGAPAAVAAAFAAANGGRLTACACDPGSSEARVEATVHSDGLFFVPGGVDVTIRARAVIDIPPPPIVGSTGATGPSAQ